MLHAGLQRVYARWVKAQPNVPDPIEIATGAVEGGRRVDPREHPARLDTESGEPVLGWPAAAGSPGSPVHPVAVGRCGNVAAFPVADRRVGGVISGRDAVEPLLRPAPYVSRWAPRPSATPGRRGRCCTGCRGG